MEPSSAHVPFNIASVVSAFLKRVCNKGLVEVTGNRIDRGVGYGLEIPYCTARISFMDLLYIHMYIVCKLRADGLT